VNHGWKTSGLNASGHQDGWAPLLKQKKSTDGSFF